MYVDQMNKNHDAFFVVGGTMRPDSPSYIERLADQELFEHSLRQDFCYVLTSRQMGKSSLMARTSAKLRSRGVQTAIVDLAELGSEKQISTGESWYYGIAHKIWRDLKSTIDLKSWWQQRSDLPTLQRLTEFFDEITNEQATDSPVVVFIDEIDTTIGMPFTDDFFAAIRACYNNRAISEKYGHLTFVLLGVASPSDLIKEPLRTPFNIGHRIELTDFTFQEARPLACGLTIEGGVGERILQSILHWTGGHPYLTQKLCYLVLKNKSATCTEKDIEEVVVDNFFAGAVFREDSNLNEVRRRLVAGSHNSKEVLDLYGRIRRGESIVDDPLSSVQTALKLSGIVVAGDDKRLHVRNRIYRGVFTDEWVMNEEQALVAASTETIASEQALAAKTEKLPQTARPSFLKNQFTKLRMLAADYIEQILRILFSKFYKRYVAKLRAQNKFFNVKGVTVQTVFSLELQKVFIDLNISTYKTVRATATGRLHEPFKSIWQLLESKEAQHRVLAIIGKPGSGKTTMLQYVTLLIATRGARRKSRSYIPFHLPLRKFVAEIVKPAAELPTLSRVLEMEAGDIEPPANWFLRKLENHGHRCVVMLDGLDEVAEPRERKKMAEWVKQQTEIYPNTRFIITSRPHGYLSNPIENATVLLIEDFSEPQIREFVNKWYRSTEIAAAGKSDRDVLARAEENAKDLLQRIFQSEILSKLALNPLLLTMITMVHRYVGKLPEMRAALYEDIIRVLLAPREIAIKGIRLNYYQKREILQTLAFAMMRERRRDIAIRDAIAIIRPALELVNLRAEDGKRSIETIMNESGLLVENEIGRLAFAHLTYQEFLTAAEIKNRQKEALLIENLSDTWWHEAILLYTATSDATGIVRACLNQPQRSLENLKLAYEISEEAMQIAPQERKRLEDILVLEADSADREAQQLAADLIFEIRLRRMVRLAQNIDVDRFFISQLEYQSFIHDTNRRPDHWSGLRYPFREGLQPIVGVRRDDGEAFAQWLTARARELGHRTSKFRLPTEDEVRLVRTDEDVQDRNFRLLASPEVGAWVMPENALVFSENEKSAAISSSLRMRVLGDGETRRVRDYHSSMDNLFEKINQQIEDLRKQLQTTLKQLDGAILPSVLTSLPEEVDRYLGNLNAIKYALRNVASLAQERRFNLVLDSGMIDELQSALVELSRLGSSRAGAAAYQDSDTGKIRQLLSETRLRLERLRGVLFDPTSRARQYQQNLMNLLSTELDSFAGKPIDLNQQLAFLSKLGDIRLSTNEIQAVLRREIGKDYTKAKSELLALAEYALYQNKTELLREILRGFWAVFFVEQRANRQNPLPAWEGIRLVREIRRPDEETTHI